MVSWNVVGAPPITAHLGFAGAIAHRWGLKAKGIAVLHHGVDHEGTEKFGRLEPSRVRGVPLQVNESARQKKFSLSDQPCALTHYEASLVLKMQGEAAVLEELREAAVDGRLKQWLQSTLRLAGGPLVSIGGVLLADYQNEALGKLPKTGHFVVDVSQELSPENAEQDPLDRAIALLYPRQDQGDGQSEENDEGSPKNDEDRPLKRWLALSNLGFLRLSEVAHREGVRQDLPHAFAEPLLGLVEYVPLRRAARRSNLPIFWSFTHPQDDVIVARASN